MIADVRVSRIRLTYTFGNDGRYRTEFALGDDGLLYSHDPDDRSRAGRVWLRVDRRDERKWHGVVRSVLEENSVDHGDSIVYEEVRADVTTHARLVRGEVVR